MTYRERREARAERLRGWANKRQTEATSTLATIHERYAGDHGFNFQPGHIPERARVIAREERAFESLEKADRMDERAGNIEKQLDRAIYSDDENATDALRVRIANLEAERTRVKAFNDSCRKGAANPSLLDEAQRASLAGLYRIGSAFVGKAGGFPSYHLTNLSGNIARNRERLARLEGTYVQPGMVKCASCDHVKDIHGPKARPGCDECGQCAGFVAACVV